MPPGSSCSVALTAGYVDSEPGSLKGVQVNVDDADAAHDFLRDRGVEVSEIQAFPWGRFCFFSDPDGNTWSVHEPPPAARGRAPRRSLAPDADGACACRQPIRIRHGLGAAVGPPLCHSTCASPAT